jgi:nucleotide-binding universal stress UspA family protein
MRQPLTFSEPDPELERLLSAEVAHAVGILPPGNPTRVRLRMGVGSPGEQLAALAQEEHADLLVVGTHHRRGVGQLWSVSHHAVQRANMSVVCVPASTSAEDAAIPSMSSVVAATDFSAIGDRAVPYAFGLLATGGTVHLVHVLPTEPTADERQRLEAKLRLLIPRVSGEHAKRGEAHVLWGEPSHAIAQAAERLDADAICVGSRARGSLAKAVLGSVSEALLARTDRPVLIVPRLRGEAP